MPNLFLIDGVAGGGKNEFIKYCIERDSSANQIVKKYTTKAKDKIKREDLVYISESEYKEKSSAKDFHYIYPSVKGAKYLIQRADIDAALNEYKNVFIIVRSLDIIKEIKRAYETYINVNVVPIFMYCSKKTLIERTKKETAAQGVPDFEIEARVADRISRNQECLNDYDKDNKSKVHFYKHIFRNELSTDDTGEYDKERDRLYSYINDILNIYKDFDNAYEEPSVFVIMPMPEGKEAAHFFNVKKAGFKAFRADDLAFNQEGIIYNIFDAIKESTVCLADLTNSRPNCYFEAGIAYGLFYSQNLDCKIPKCYFLAEEGERIEFDVSGIDVTKYTYNANEYSQISQKVEDLLTKYKNKYIFPIK